MAEQTPEDRLRLAAAMIKDGQYKGAAAILRKTDHPKAREWLQKLELKINDVPDDPFTQDAPSVARKKRERTWWWLIAVVAVIGLGALYVFAPGGFLENVNVRTNLIVYCVDAYFGVGDDTGIDGCSAWINTALETQRDAITTCYRQNVGYPASFNYCLREAAVVPPGISPY